VTTKNELIWLASGIAGENQARAQSQALTFTRVEIGDADGSQPPLDPAITALVNKVADGMLESHTVDPDDPNQRIVLMHIPPTDNYNAREILLYAKYGTTEFPHTYIRLADAYPVRTIDNGGSQVALKLTVRVSQHSSFTINVSPNLAYATEDFVKNSFLPVFVGGDQVAQASRRHVFTGPANLDLPDLTDGNFIRVEVLPSVDLSLGECKLVPPSGKKIRVNGQLHDDAVIQGKGVEYTLDIINGVYTA